MPSKRFQEAKKLVNNTKIYSIDEAIELVKKTATAKYDESIELHVRLGIDATKSDQQVRGTISFPHGVGKTKRVAAFVEPDKESEAKESGADIIGNQETIDKILQTGAIDFDVAIATPAMMPKLAKLARILGPRGIMPNPKTDTVSQNVKKMIEEQKAGKQSFKNDKDGNLHQVFGRKSFTSEQLKDNLITILDTMRRLKPSSSKGIFFKSITIASTVGPGIKIEG